MPLTIGDSYPFLNSIRYVGIDFDLLGVRAGNCFRNAGIFKWGDLADKTQAELFVIPNFGQTSYDEIIRLLESGSMITSLTSHRDASIEHASVAELKSELEEANKRLKIKCFPSQVAEWAIADLRAERVGDVLSTSIDTVEMPQHVHDGLKMFLDNRLAELTHGSHFDVDSFYIDLLPELKSGFNDVGENLEAITFSEFETRLQESTEKFEEFLSEGKSELEKAKKVLEVACLPRQVAGWAGFVLGAERIRDIFSPVMEISQSPSDIQEELKRFLDTELEGLEHDSFLIPELFEMFLSRLDDRPREIFYARAIERRKVSFRELGESMGVTAEAVRRMLARAEDSYRSIIKEDEFLPLRWMADRCRSQVFPFRFFPKGEGDLRSFIAESVPEGFYDVDDFSVDNLIEFLMWLADFNCLTEDNWLILDVELFEVTDAAFAEMTADMKLVELREVAGTFKDLGHPKPLDLAREFLSSKGWRKMSESQYGLWKGSAVEKAVVVLEMQGKPLTSHEIVEIIGEGHNPESLQNAFPHDERFVRTDQFQRYGLSKWGLEEYSGIYEEICERIERGGGEASVKAILEEFTRLFGVAENSVKVNLKNGSFQVSGDVVSFSENFEFDPVDPSLIDDAVETSEGWGQKIVINEEYLNGGYSFQISADIAYANGVRPGDRLILPVYVVPEWNGQVSVIWRKQAVFRRIDVGRHRELLQRDFSIGDEIIVVPGREKVSIFRST